MSLPPSETEFADSRDRKKRQFAEFWTRNLRKTIDWYFGARCMSCGSDDFDRLKIYDMQRRHAIGENRLRRMLKDLRWGAKLPSNLEVMCDRCARARGWRVQNVTPRP